MALLGMLGLQGADTPSKGTNQVFGEPEIPMSPIPPHKVAGAPLGAPAALFLEQPNFAWDRASEDGWAFASSGHEIHTFCVG